MIRRRYISAGLGRAEDSRRGFPAGDQFARQIRAPAGSRDGSGPAQRRPKHTCPDHSPGSFMHRFASLMCSIREKQTEEGEVRSAGAAFVSTYFILVFGEGSVKFPPSNSRACHWS